MGKDGFFSGYKKPALPKDRAGLLPQFAVLSVAAAAHWNCATQKT